MTVISIQQTKRKTNIHKNNPIMLRKKFLAIPEETRQSIWNFCHRFKTEGYECFLVGGSCRDLLLDEVPHDFDFATNCPLSVTKTLFKKVIATGEAHGTLSVRFDGHLFEITRYRRDIETDGRRAVIQYSDSIEEDQQRRDIRINSLAYDVVSGRAVDSQAGFEDFKNKIIRFVGEARERILEDHLRAIRYIRLIVRLQPFGFRFDQEEMDHVVEVFDGSKLSLERIYEELAKINLISDKDIHFCSEQMARLNIFKEYFSDEIQAKAVVHSVIEKESLMPLFFEFSQNHSLKETIITLKLSRKQRKILELLHRFKNSDWTKITHIKKLLSQVDLKELESTTKAFFDIYLVNLLPCFRRVISRKDPIYVSDLAISGDDVKRMGVCGKEVGQVLRQLQTRVWETPELNEFESLRRLVQLWSVSNRIHPPGTQGI